jgi:pseudouridine-5'-phosphate glycosidase
MDDAQVSGINLGSPARVERSQSPFTRTPSLSLSRSQIKCAALNLAPLPLQARARLAVLAAHVGPAPPPPPTTTTPAFRPSPTAAPAEAAAAAAAAGVALHPDVAAALRSGSPPVVALESTIVAHGMPWPANLETARAVEGVVRAAGCVPATIAVLGGVPTIGLTDAQLERVARGGKAIKKVSTRDLGAVVAAGRDGATTVAATAALASRAGIAVFVTGGLGGVHRGGEATMDVSADLDVLARTPLAVVCAGAKSVLDIPRTLEALETRGVPVVAVGQDTVPAFFSRCSGCPAPARVDTPAQAAALVAAHLRLGPGGGVILAVPCPPGHEAAASAAEAATAAAVASAEAAGATGAAATPFILAALADATGGASLAANIALVKNNAAFGSAVAVELVKRRQGGL